MLPATVNLISAFIIVVGLIIAFSVYLQLQSMKQSFVSRLKEEASKIDDTTAIVLSVSGAYSDRVEFFQTLFPDYQNLTSTFSGVNNVSLRVTSIKDKGVTYVNEHGSRVSVNMSSNGMDLLIKFDLQPQRDRGVEEALPVNDGRNILLSDGISFVVSDTASLQIIELLQKYVDINTVTYSAPDSMTVSWTLTEVPKLSVVKTADGKPAYAFDMRGQSGLGNKADGRFIAAFKVPQFPWPTKKTPAAAAPTTTTSK